MFHCANDQFAYGLNCLKLFDLKPDVDSMTYQDASKFCNLAKLELFASNAIYDLRHEAAGKHHMQLVYVNTSIQNVTQSDQKLKCYDLRTNYASIVECQKPFTLICSKKRRKIVNNLIF